MGGKILKAIGALVVAIVAIAFLCAMGLFAFKLWWQSHPLVVF